MCSRVCSTHSPCTRTANHRLFPRFRASTPIKYSKSLQYQTLRSLHPIRSGCLHAMLLRCSPALSSASAHRSRGKRRPKRPNVPPVTSHASFRPQHGHKPMQRRRREPWLRCRQRPLQDKSDTVIVVKSISIDKSFEDCLSVVLVMRLDNLTSPAYLVHHILKSQLKSELSLGWLEGLLALQWQ